MKAIQETLRPDDHDEVRPGADGHTVLLSRPNGQGKQRDYGLAELTLRILGLGSRRYSTRRQLQNAT